MPGLYRRYVCVVCGHVEHVPLDHDGEEPLMERRFAGRACARERIEYRPARR